MERTVGFSRSVRVPSRVLHACGALVMVLAASGCTAVDAYHAGAALRGQPFAAAIDRYGQPTEIRPEADGRVAVWRRQQGGNSCELTIRADVKGVISDQTLNGGGGGLSACDQLLSKSPARGPGS